MLLFLILLIFPLLPGLSNLHALNLAGTELFIVLYASFIVFVRIIVLPNSVILQQLSDLFSSASSYTLCPIRLVLYATPNIARAAIFGR